MTLSATDSTDRVDQLIALTERLTELIAQEAQAFEQHRPQDASAKLPEVSKLANIYRHESARVRETPSLIASASITQRTRLVRATEAFDAVLARQGRALEAAKTVTEGLVRAIAEEVADQRAGAAGYGPTALTTTPTMATSITLNKRA